MLLQSWRRGGDGHFVSSVMVVGNHDDGRQVGCSHSSCRHAWKRRPVGSESLTTAHKTCNAKSCPQDRTVFGPTSLANTLMRDPQEGRFNSKEATLCPQHFLTGKTGTWRQFGVQYVLRGA